MTRQHYMKVASILSDARNKFASYDYYLTSRPEAEVVISAIEHDLASMFKSDNPRFKLDKFTEAAKGGLDV